MAMNSIISRLASSLRLEAVSAEPEVTVVDSVAALAKAKEIIAGLPLLTMDCEGVDLCRSGSVTIVQIGTRSQCFLFDVLTLNRSSEIAKYLKSILEDPAVIKIIHDAKMDADALQHLLGIRLTGVHDTQACDMLLHNRGELNLNDTLKLYGCRSNVVRDSSVYEINPAFWASRPLTPQMIKWASGDVTSLLELYEIQISKASTEMRERFRRASEEKAEHLRCMIAEVTSAPHTRFLSAKRCCLYPSSRATRVMCMGRASGRRVCCRQS
jgi:ribonuclease D